MSEFEQSRWADPAFSRDYVDNADHYIPERSYLFHILRSYYRAFVAKADPRPIRVCDLGCGDGIVTEQLLRESENIEATLVDGSAEMLATAKRRFAARRDIRYLQRGFDELIGDSTELGCFDFIVSAFAIHHLGRQPRREFFATAFRQLEPGGSFMNIEATLPNAAAHTEWYYLLWQEWIVQHGQALGFGAKFRDIPKQARENPDNQYSPLGEQLADLTAAGFADVECHYKNGIFAIYAGRKT